MSDNLRPFICELRAIAKAAGASLSGSAGLDFNSVAGNILERAVEAETRRCAARARAFVMHGFEIDYDDDYKVRDHTVQHKAYQNALADDLLKSAGLEPEEITNERR